MIKNLNGFEGLKDFVTTYRYLMRYANKLQRLNERACNEAVNLDKLKEKYEAIEDVVNNLLRRFEMKAYIQRDPRGCPLWIVPESWSEEEVRANYIKGIAVF